LEFYPLKELFLTDRKSCVVPREALRTDARQRLDAASAQEITIQLVESGLYLVVRVLAAGDQLQPEVNVPLPIQHEASQNEVATIETCKVSGFLNDGGVVVLGKEG